MSDVIRSVSTHAQQSTPNKIDHRMKLYSAAAIAAGVGALALAQTAEGEVVITRKNIPIPISQYGFPTNPVLISLNNNGINDFSFSLYSFAYHSANMDLTIRPLEGGAVMDKETAARGGSTFFAQALSRGAKIGPSAHFSSKGYGEAVEDERRIFNYSNSTSVFFTYGNWGKNPSNKYLGVKFLIDGETHYGWVRLTVSTGPGGLAGTITAYAYETEANKRILAGLPEGEKPVILNENKGASLGALAAGADGLSHWRH
jgi:hypothetical protein